MTRTMGDAIAANVPKLHAATFDLYAGYVTGTDGTKGTLQIKWTAADWSLFPASKRVTIDQGYGPHVLSATVRDVEAGAWSVAAAVNRTGWTAVRPTIYCSVSDLPALGAAGWKGDVWVAWYNGNPAFDFTPPPGINVVAKQYTDTGGGGAYDLSTVFDPHWPQEAPMVFGTHEPTSANPGKYALTYVDSNGQAQEQTGWVECVHCKGLYWLNQQAASKCVGNPA